MLKDFKSKIDLFKQIYFPVVKLFLLDILVSDNILSWEKMKTANIMI